MDEREFWLLVRQGLLLLIDAIERHCGLQPRTSSLRRDVRKARVGLW